jgi:PAS domain S-box-containing protein
MIRLSTGWVMTPAALILFLMATGIAIGALYVFMASRDRERDSDRLKAANESLTEALKAAAAAKERAEANAEAQRKMNVDLVEMRSALMNVLEDVEESKRQIEADNRLDAAVFAAMRESMIATDAEGRILLFNPMSSALVGIAPAEAIGQPIHSVLKLMPEESDVMVTSPLDAAFAGKGGRLPEKLTVIRKDGSRVPVAGTTAPFFDTEGKLIGVVCVIRDVTLERDIDRQKSGFISIASHQLRTPLSAIRWYVDLLLAGDAGKLSKQQKEFLTDMGDSTARMIKLVGDLLNVSRIESGKVMMNPAQIDLVALLRSLKAEFEPAAAAKKLACGCKIPDDLPKVVADPNALRQAIGNLIANAINYTPEGGKISISARTEGKNAVIEVRDTGIGIPKAQQHRLFERFFRAENAVARETVGSGLGLYITRMLIEAAKGRIRFESAEGKGTAFTVTLPAA